MNYRGWRQGIAVLVALLTTGADVNRPFLWKVQSDRATVYLFGSLHAARAEMYPLDDRVYRAFDAADKLVLEADISGEKVFVMAGQMTARAMYPPGDSLAKHLSPALYAKATAKLEQLGLPPDQFKPWFLAMMLEAVALESAGLGMQHGMELHFIARGDSRKPILELEGAAAQIALLDGLTDPQQELFLGHILDSVDQLDEALNQMLAAWRSGDDEQLDKFLKKSMNDAPEFAPIYRKLFDERNARMAAKITDYLQTDETYFVVVGAGHLVGDQGLLKILGQQFKVTRP